MPIEFKRAYLEEIRSRYRNSTKKQKGKILDEFCEVCGYTRKHAVKILKGTLNPRIKRPGPKSKYQREDVLRALKELWQLMNQMCSKKMVVAFVDWLPFSIIGVATDNGTEFLNEEVIIYLRKRAAPINMVRRREPTPLFLFTN